MQKLPIRLSLVEDLPEVMEDLVNIFSGQEDFEIQSTYRNAEDAITFLPKSDVKIAIVDIGLPGKSGIDCVRQVKALRPDIEFLMYTVLAREDKIFESLRAGASGYLLKTAKDEKIISSVRELAEGGSPMSPAIARRVTQFFFGGQVLVKELKLLSQREKEVLDLLSRGLLYKEIANELSIVIGTVKQHIHSIYQKLHVSNRTEAINLYLGRDSVQR